MRAGVFDRGPFERVQAEWLAITQHPLPDLGRFSEIKSQADALINAGRWTSGPFDMLSVLGRQRDELVHSRLIGWLMAPTGRHGLGRAFLSGFVDALWPGEGLLRTGPVLVETEVSGMGMDDDGRLHEARADIVVRGDGLTIVIENKLDAGEQPEQCERLYWGWAAEPGDKRWVFLTPSGRVPVTTTSEAARGAWRTMSYRGLRDVVERALDEGASLSATGRPTATQYLATLTEAIAR
jgi:hypothetical protein